MKILHVINSLTSGGAEKMLLDIAAIQNASGHIVEVLCLSSKKDRYKDAFDEQKIKVFFSPFSFIYNPLHILFIRREIKKYDIVNVHLFPSFYFTALANFFLFKKQPLVLTEHNNINNRMGKFPFKYIERFMYAQYKGVICISTVTAYCLKNWINSKENFLHVINNGINIENYSKKLQKQKAIDENINDKIVLIMVARFNLQKDHYTVVKALNLLPPNYELWFVGEGYLQKEVEKLVQELNLKNSVKFLGFRKDVNTLFAQADVCVVSSNYEGFGLVAAEAMASNVPVIASNVEGLNEVVAGAGILFEKGDYKELAQKIKELMSDSDLYANVQIKQEKRVLKYDIKSTTQKYLDVYTNLLKK